MTFDERTAHWFMQDTSPHLEHEEAVDLSEYFELCLENHSVEESIRAVQQMWPIIVYGEGDAVIL